MYVHFENVSWKDFCDDCGDWKGGINIHLGTLSILTSYQNIRVSSTIWNSQEILLDLLNI